MSQKWIEEQLAKHPSASVAEPNMKPGKGDHNAGVLYDPELRDIWRLLDYYYQSMVEIEIAGDYMEISDAVREEREQDHKLFHASYNALSGYFWIVMYWKFPAIRGKPRLAICEGWQIIHGETGEEEGSSFPDIFFEVPEHAFEAINPEEPDEELVGEFPEVTRHSKRLLH